jgi:hypothetical protein
VEGIVSAEVKYYGPNTWSAIAIEQPSHNSVQGLMLVSPQTLDLHRFALAATMFSRELPANLRRSMALISPWINMSNPISP